MGCVKDEQFFRVLSNGRFVVWASPEAQEGSIVVLLLKSPLGPVDTWVVEIAEQRVRMEVRNSRTFRDGGNLNRYLHNLVPDGVFWEGRTDWRNAVMSVLEGRRSDALRT